MIKTPNLTWDEYFNYHPSIIRGAVIHDIKFVSIRKGREDNT